MTPDRDDELVSIPRWVAGVLAEEVMLRTTCKFPHDELGCPRCDAIRIAEEAYQRG